MSLSPAEYDQRIAAAGRPRLFFDAGELERLKEAIRTTHREKWEKLKAAVDDSVDRDPPEYQAPRVGGDSTRPGTLNDEMLWQRTFGYTVPGMALVALLDGDRKYFELARRWALKPAEYPLWGAGIFENTGLAAKHQLFGLSIAYDWLHEMWSGEDRERLRHTLRERGRHLYEAAEGINNRGWWKHTWRQNHAWNGYQALGVTAMALAGEEKDAGVWFQKALWGGHHIVAELSDEGAYEEGIPYWGYGMEALVRFITAAKPYSDEDFYEARYFRNTHLFRLYLAGPQLWQIANFGDGLTRDWHAMRTTMYRLASEYRDPVTQWLAEQLPDRPDIDATCWGLLWYDPSVKPGLPESQPRWHAFKETGFAGARTSWREDALTLHLRSGVVNVSHSHFDVNDFLVNAGGEWLLKDYGYGKVGPGYFDRGTIYFSVSTRGHNCLVIGGKDQRPEGKGVITDAAEQEGAVWLRADATACYEGVESVVRELALVMPHSGTGKWGHVIVRDLARTKEPETFDFMLQPGGEVELSADGFLIRGKQARLVGKVLSPMGATMALAPGFGESINVDRPFSLRISAPGKARRVEFVVVLAPLAEGEAPPEIELRDGVVRVGEDRTAFSADGRSAPERNR